MSLEKIDHWRLEPLFDPAKTRGGVGWDVNVSWHLQSKNGTQTLGRTHTHTHTHTRTHARTHARTHTHAHVRTRTHTHTKRGQVGGWDQGENQIKYIVSIYSNFTRINEMVSSCSVSQNLKWQKNIDVANIGPYLELPATNIWSCK